MDFIVVIASRSMRLLQEWLQSRHLLDQGRVVVNGSIEAAIDTYHASSGGEHSDRATR
jgi:ABC-type polysaccharide/polyol phosphate transport system ATPase subunit